jgi:hypothetical protein
VNGSSISEPVLWFPENSARLWNSTSQRLDYW